MRKDSQFPTSNSSHQFTASIITLSVFWRDYYFPQSNVIHFLCIYDGHWDINTLLNSKNLITFSSIKQLCPLEPSGSVQPCELNTFIRWVTSKHFNNIDPFRVGIFSSSLFVRELLWWDFLRFMNLSWAASLTENCKILLSATKFHGCWITKFCSYSFKRKAAQWEIEKNTYLEGCDGPVNRYIRCLTIFRNVEIILG